MACDADLSSKLKSAAYAAVRLLSGDDPDVMPVLMSGAGHDAMAMSHLTKVPVSHSTFYACLTNVVCKCIFKLLNVFLNWSRSLSAFCLYAKLQVMLLHGTEDVISAYIQYRNSCMMRYML